MRKKVEAPLTISRVMEIAKNGDFRPSKLDTGFRNWARKGLIILDQMFEGDIFCSFKQLQDTFGLGSHDFYRYLQLRNYLMSHREWNTLKRTPTSIELLLIRIVKEKSVTKMLSQIYKCLQGHMSGNTLDIKEQWEMEMNVIIDDDSWEDGCERGHKITNGPSWK